MVLAFRSRRAIVLLAAMLVLSPLGCDGNGKGKPDTVSISGKVAYANGKPLTAGTIVFNPSVEGEVAPLAAIQPDGSFVFSSENGIPPGEYRVSLATPEGETAPAEGEKGESKASSFPVPVKYLQAETSGWTATVKESDNAPFSFTIK